MSIGVVIGRFQVPSLHSGHMYLLEYVASRNEQLVVFLGCTRGLATDKDPLPYDMRVQLIQERFPHAVIFPIFDNPSDEAWSKDIDNILDNVFIGKQKVLYGSRKSFLEHYHGRYATQFVEPMHEESGTRVRNGITSIASTDSFRSGHIHAIMNRLPLIYPVVDIACVRPAEGKVLLARKPTDPSGRYRFIGGFVDSKDTTLECAARREFREETGGNLEISKLYNIGSCLVQDWRYVGTKDKIMSTFYVTFYTWGALKPSDDIVELKWFDYHGEHFDKLYDIIVDTHVFLLNIFFDWANPTEPEEATDVESS